MRACFAAVLLVASAGAWSADNGFYLGAAVTQAGFEQDDLDLDELGNQVTDLDDEDTSFKLIAGLRLLDTFGVEANYIDFGEATTDALPLIGEAFAEAKGFGAFAVGFLPLGIADLYLKAGGIYTEIETGAGAFSLDDDSVEFAYGAGAQLRFGSLAARLEYERFEVDLIDDLDLLSLGVTYTFL